jgi:hypothetical protein
MLNNPRKAEASKHPRQDRRRQPGLVTCSDGFVSFAIFNKAASVTRFRLLFA